VTAITTFIIECHWEILCKILLRHLKQVADTIYSESQSGFQAQQSTTDMIFVVHQLVGKPCEQRRPLFLAFVDLTIAFDLLD